MDGSQSGAHHHFFLISWRGEERDIVANRAGKEDIILHHDAHAVARGNHVFHAAFPLIQINLARFGGEIAEQYIKQRRFAAAGRPDNRHRIARVNRKRHIIQHIRLIFAVTETQMLNADTHRLAGGGDDFSNDGFRLAHHNIAQAGSLDAQHLQGEVIVD